MLVSFVGEFFMSLEDKERLEREMKEKVLGSLKSRDEIGQLISFTLKNFSYRYLETDSTGEGVPSETEDEIFIKLTEPQLSQALKTQNKETRKGLIDLAKSFSKKERPAACYFLGVKILSLNSEGGGDFELYGTVNWNFPDFSEDPEKQNRISKCVSYDNGFDLRNDLARVLEEVCEVF